MKQLLLVVASVLLLGIRVTWADTYEDGIAAYKRGDYARALKIYQSLAVRGNAKAQNNLGVLYLNGEGVLEDYVEAVKWFKLAAAQGNISGQENLAVMYFYGYGTNQNNAPDYVRAHMWFNFISASENATATEKSSARDARDKATKFMTPQQIIQAQKMAQTCLKRRFKACD